MFKRLIIATAAAATLAVSHAGPAAAAGEWGPYAAASVYCTNGSWNFGVSELQVQGKVSRHLGFSWQWVAYTHRLRNVRTGAVTRLYIDGQASYMFNDNRTYINTGVPYTGQNFTWNWYDVAPGYYVLETKYYWHSGYWAESPWIVTTAYSNNGESYMSNVCSL